MYANVLNGGENDEENSAIASAYLSGNARAN